MHAKGHGSSEYRRNAAHVMQVTNTLINQGVAVFCGICRENFRPGDVMSVDHVIRLRDGGSHKLTNLRPVHARCNSERG